MRELSRKDTSWKQHPSPLQQLLMQSLGGLTASSTAKMRCYSSCQCKPFLTVSSLCFLKILLAGFPWCDWKCEPVGGRLRKCSPLRDCWSNQDESKNIKLEQKVFEMSKSQVYLSGMPELRLGLNDKVVLHETVPLSVLGEILTFHNPGALRVNWTWQI